MGAPTARAPQILADLLERALALGASVGGYVPAERLKDCPSARAAGQQGFLTFSGTIVVLGLYHDPKKPEMDWWEEGRSTPGDRMLRRINLALAAWLEEVHGIGARDIPYQVHDGGIYLKDAAVLAGLGCIGRNNLVINPEYGPRLRFRALWVDIPTEPRLLPAMPSHCEGCPHPCETACPRNALEGGVYSRTRCLSRINADKAAPVEQTGKKGPVNHCRVCELVCPAARRDHPGQ
jgi:epoxyqueuosine reductase